MRNWIIITNFQKNLQFIEELMKKNLKVKSLELVGLPTEVVEFFAFREEELTSERSKRIVLAATVHKADIVTCLLGRNEYEFIVAPKCLLDIHVLLNQRTNLYDIYVDEVRHIRL